MHRNLGFESPKQGWIRHSEVCVPISVPNLALQLNQGKHTLVRMQIVGFLYENITFAYFVFWGQLSPSLCAFLVILIYFGVTRFLPVAQEVYILYRCNNLIGFYESNIDAKSCRVFSVYTTDIHNNRDS